MTATITDRLDGLASSTAVKGPCKAASTTNLTLSGEQTVNAVSCVADDRVLVTGQTDGTENGVYVVSTGAWRRAKDFSSNNDVRKGTQVRVNEGANAGIWVVSTSDPIVFDTSTITMTRDTSLTSGALMAANDLSDVASPVDALWNLRSNGGSINAAATLVLDDATGDQVDIAGNTTITAVTLAEGREVWCRFTGTPQITVGASLVGNGGGANITLAAGDIVRFRGYAAGVVRFTVFRVSGQSVVASSEPEVIVVSVTGETTVLTTGTAKRTFRMPFAMALSEVRASLTTASSSGAVTVDINEGGATILSTKLTIDANEKTSTTAATAPVISDAALADDAEMTIDIDGAGTNAAGLKIYLIGTRA